MHVLSAGGFVAMSREAFGSEDLLQEMLATNPDLMPGELVDPNSPRRWLLVTREAGIALAGSGAGNRWSLDHLFLDQDGIPTLVEVKRAEDTRGRREVVAQMLDYAASLGVWGPGRIRDVLRDRCSRSGVDIDQTVVEFVGPDGDVDAFWERVDTNLAGGRLRLVFLSDHISAELRQIIEFLNGQFQRAEVIGVEVRQWKGEGVTTLVSDVVGRTTAAAAAKGQGQSAPRLTADEFDQLLVSADPADAGAIRDLMMWCVEHGGFVSFGTGRSWPSCYLNWRTATGAAIWPLVPTLPSYVTVAFDGLAARPPFDDEGLREELRLRLATIDGIELPLDSLSRRPSFPLAAIRSSDARAHLFDVLSWFVQQLGTPVPTAH